MRPAMLVETVIGPLASETAREATAAVHLAL
jgi:hypothetical protein